MKNFFKLDKPTFSFEIFPPKGAGDLSQIFSTVDALASLDPDLISVTYGAGGTSRENTAEIASRIQRDYAIPALAHLTCVGSTREEMRATLDKLKEKGIQNILAMRGDINNEGTKDFKYASELIKFINDNYDFRVFAACYPEKHEEAPNMDTDIYWLKKKMEMGAEYAVTQLFYDNRKYFDFVERARQAGVTIPIIPGIKPFKKLSQLSIIPKTFKVDLPEELTQEVLKCNTDAEAQQVGIEWCVQQCKELIAHGVPSLHFYSVGATDSIREVAKQIY